MREIYFRGQSSKSFGLLTKSIRIQIMAPHEFDILNLNGRNGAIFTRSTMTHRTFDTEFYLPAANYYDLDNKKKQIAKWLHTHTEEEFYVTGGLDLRYKAKVKGAIDFDKDIYDGTFKVQFVASDPLGYSPATVSQQISNGQAMTVGGLAPTFPTFKMTPTAAMANGFRITNDSTGQYVQIIGALTAGKQYIINMNYNTVERVESTGNISIMDKIDIDSDFFSIVGGTKITTNPTTGYTLIAEWKNAYY